MKRTFLIAAGVLAAAAAWAQDAPREGQRIDDRRPEAPFSIDLLGLPVQLTGSWEYTDEKRRNFDLDASRARDRRVREHEVKLEARTRPTPGTEVFVQAVGLHESRRTQGTPGKQVTKSLERGQAWVRWERLGGSGWDLQAGRVALIDRRAFWWDDDLDAVRATWQGDGLKFDTGLARELARVSSAEHGIAADARGVTRWFGQAEWRPDRLLRVDGFWLHQRDRSGAPTPGSVIALEDDTDPSDFNATWLGLRASGDWRHASGLRLQYRADAAWLRGRDAVTAFDEGSAGFTAGTTATRRVRGQARDLGATLVLPLPLRPSLSVGSARGSKDFRQTGLHENKARLAGVKRLRMYGELLQPDLQNLRVRSVGAGIRLLENSSFEVVRYRYRQPVAADGIAGGRLSTDPRGTAGDLGREIDLVLALREWRALEFTLRWSRFRPGAAFAANRQAPARAFEFGLALNF